MKFKLDHRPIRFSFRVCKIFVKSCSPLNMNRGVITGCSLSGLRARKLLGEKIFLANALFGITGFSELANSLGK